MIKVFIIDDSALVRAFLSEILTEDKEIEIVGQTLDAYFAMDKIKKLQPDVIILDIQMPKMSGIEFLEKLMDEYPTPVIMFSSLTNEGSSSTLEALNLGALDYVPKPQDNLSVNLKKVKDEIIRKIKSLSKVKMKEILEKRPEIITKKGLTRKSETQTSKTIPPSTTISSREKPKISDRTKHRKSDKIIVIGASTGGTRAVAELLKGLPPDIPPIVIVQHMPPIFTTRFAEDMNSRLPLDVFEAKNGDVLESGKVLVAPGAFHVTLKSQGNKYILNVIDGPPVNHHKPSVDVLFRSASRTLKNKAIGVILTGMGKDGAVGMKEMKDAGAYNIAQDEKTCVVFGMPKEAIEAGATDKVLPLSEIAKHIVEKVGF